MISDILYQMVEDLDLYLNDPRCDAMYCGAWRERIIRLRDDAEYIRFVLDTPYPEWHLPEGYVRGQIVADRCKARERAEQAAIVNAANAFKHREAWLHAVTEQLRPIFTAHGATIPEKIRLSCGFPSVGAFAAKHQRVGECWSGTASKDGTVEILISPVLDDPMRVAGVLAHELVHATGRHGHKGAFATVARAIGLEGKMTATTEGEAFKQAVAPILEAVGRYPHAELSKTARKKQGTRLLKVQCPTCPYTVRITRKWLDEVGPPACPSHGDNMGEA